MASAGEVVKTDVLVLGAGISGLVTAKCMRDVGFDVVVLERTGDIGGLWTYKEKGYGVMKFTHINVSKENYSFSDFPFPEEVEDFPHNATMANYIHDYTKHFGVDKVIRFHMQVNKLAKKGSEWEVIAERVQEDDKGVITSTGQQQTFVAKFVAIATGHHAKPVYPNFPGQDTFTGKAYHSIDYKDAHTNGLLGKKVVLVGIGNSAIDAACNAATVGMCKPVYVSSRSGAWVVPNYVFGRPVDHYACRLFLWLPWRVATVIFETVLKLIQGNPKKWNLNPRMHALQTQPTVSPVFIHHIQRGEIKVVPNIKKIEGNKITFSDGQSTEADQLIYCTGYSIDLPYLSDDVRKAVLDENNNSIKLFKNAFSPEVGHTLAFIGFVQPASGGVLTMSENQARWWAELCRANITLPTKAAMEKDMKKEMDYVKSRWFTSGRHTIQRDPTIYNDEITSFFGAKPKITKHPWIAWRLLLGSCGAAQYRLQGPGKWDKAESTVCRVPVTEFILFGTILAAILGLWLMLRLADCAWDILDDVFD